MSNNGTGGGAPDYSAHPCSQAGGGVTHDVDGTNAQPFEAREGLSLRDALDSEVSESSAGEPVSRRPGSWRRIGAVATVSIALFAGFVWWRFRVPRCEIEPLEKLGRALADDDPVERLDRAPEVVDMLQRSCAAVSFETHRATTDALRQPGTGQPRGTRPPSPPWIVIGSKRYGCADQPEHWIANDDEWRRCLGLAGFPEQQVGDRSIRPSALWTVLMLEHLGVSQTAAHQLGWVLSAGRWLPLPAAARDRVHSPVVEVWTALRPPETTTILGIEESIPDGEFPDGFIIDSDVTVSQMHEARVAGPGLFHAYSVALGPAFPVDVWIPLRVEWMRWDCESQPDCPLPFAEDGASTVVTLRHGEVVVRNSERSSEPMGHAHVLVPERQATWGDIVTASMAVAPADCFGEDQSPACEEPWLTLWLNRG